MVFSTKLLVSRQFEKLGIEVLQLMLLEGLFPALSYMHNSNIRKLGERELLNLITLL